MSLSDLSGVFCQYFTTKQVVAPVFYMLDLRSLHTVWNFRTVKNKYDLTLCQSRLHTASETVVRHKKNSDQVRFSAFSHP